MASKNSNIENPWFHHDENASSDIKIIKMSRHFRRLAKDLSREDSIIKVSSADNGLILTKISDGTISENKLMFNHDKIIVFDKVDEIWVENSTLEK